MRTRFFLLVLLGVAALAQDFATIPYTPTPVEAKVPWYTVKPDLSNVANAKILPKLTPGQHKLLVQNRFVARPTPDEQLFYVYENNTYHKIPSFVTTDSVLHSYHIFYDFTLRYLEQERLFAAVTALSRRMLDANLAALQEEHTPEVRVALMRNAAFFAVPLRLMGVNEPELPAQASQMTAGELARIGAHVEWGPSIITGARVNYTQFIPRGHYTRTEAFKRYFKAMMWYGLVPLNIEFDPKNNRPTLQALLMVEQLTLDSKAQELWQQIYDPTVFYVGKADDLSYYQFAPLIARIFGASNIDRFDDAAKLTAFRAAVKQELPKPGVSPDGAALHPRFAHDAGTGMGQSRHKRE